MNRRQRLKQKLIGKLTMREYRSIELSCTGCSLHRMFSTDEEVPEKFRNGCPNCNSELAVEWRRY